MQTLEVQVPSRGDFRWFLLSEPGLKNSWVRLAPTQELEPQLSFRCGSG